MLTVYLRFITVPDPCLETYQIALGELSSRIVRDVPIFIYQARVGHEIDLGLAHENYVEKDQDATQMRLGRSSADVSRTGADDGTGFPSP